jgi:hypothetical protein
MALATRYRRKGLQRLNRWRGPACSVAIEAMLASTNIGLLLRLAGSESVTGKVEGVPAEVPVVYGSWSHAYAHPVVAGGCEDVGQRKASVAVKQIRAVGLCCAKLSSSNGFPRSLPKWEVL